jgi:hypothetical protein
MTSCNIPTFLHFDGDFTFFPEQNLLEWIKFMFSQQYGYPAKASTQLSFKWKRMAHPHPFRKIVSAYKTYKEPALSGRGGRGKALIMVVEGGGASACKLVVVVVMVMMPRVVTMKV